MQITILQHSADCPPSFTSTWLDQNKMPFRVVKAYAGEPIPAAEEVDWLIVLGGGMNVDDYKNHPFLREEKKLVEQVLKAEKSYLGLCLGGQMLARVMGSEVRKHTDWEVGWFPVQIENKILGLKTRPENEELQVFHWHQDTFDLPKDTIAYAKNSVTPNQGFVTSNAAAIATQFHPEADEAWVKDCAYDDQLPKGTYCQKPDEMIRDLKFLSKQNAWFSDLMLHLATRTRSRVRE